MDSKITLSFDKDVIKRAKKFAKENNISLSRLTEFLLTKAVHTHQHSLDQLPVSDWVNTVKEGEVNYVRKARSRKAMKESFHEDRKK